MLKCQRGHLKEGEDMRDRAAAVSNTGLSARKYSWDLNTIPSNAKQNVIAYMPLLTWPGGRNAGLGVGSLPLGLE